MNWIDKAEYDFHQQWYKEQHEEWLEFHNKYMRERSILPNPDDKEPVTVHAFDTIDELITSNNALVTAEGKEYYHLPYWFQRAPDGQGWYIYTFEHMPQDLQEAIVRQRLGGDVKYPLPVNYPTFPKDAHTKTYNLWMEGYAATGESGTAQFLGSFEGATLLSAYLNYVDQHYCDNIPDYVRMNEPIIWGCRIFDNEADARKSFG